MTDKQRELALEIEALSPAAKLRLAADLLEQKRPGLAHALANRVATELGAVLALRDLEG